MTDSNINGSDRATVLKTLMRSKPEWCHKNRFSMQRSSIISVHLTVVCWNVEDPREIKSSTAKVKQCVCENVFESAFTV